MQAALITGKNSIELRDMPEPAAAGSKAVVEIGLCGICGTDLHAFQSGAPYNPAICGHEWMGRVTALGPEANGREGAAETLREGDRVGIGVPPACGECSECKAGDAPHCMRVMLSMLGIGPMHTAHGGFAPAIAVEAARLYPVRDALSDLDAAMLEPATVAVHAVRRTPLQLGDTAVVLGAGPIGLIVQQCAFANGAGCVVMVEPDPARGKLALELGATALIDPGAEDVDAAVKRVCGPLGADVVFECAGVPTTINQSATLVRRGGVVSLVGLANVPAEIVPATWLIREVQLVASLAYLHEEFATTMQLIDDGRLRLGPLHTSTVGLGGLAAAFGRLLGNEGDVKVLVDPRLE